jgi:hypothetical protein
LGREGDFLKRKEKVEKKCYKGLYRYTMSRIIVFCVIYIINISSIFTRCLGPANVCSKFLAALMDRNRKQTGIIFLVLYQEFGILTYAMKKYFVKICKCSDKSQIHCGNGYLRASNRLLNFFPSKPVALFDVYQ